MCFRVVLALFLALSSLSFAPAPLPRRDRTVDYQKLANATCWLAPEKEALKSCLTRPVATYAVEAVAQERGQSTVRITKAGKEVYSWEGHFGTVFLVIDDVIYYAVFHPNASGCAVVAYDLAARKQLWRSELKGMGPVDHSKYFNAVRMETLGAQALAVYGKESAGRYVEFVALKSGATVGHKVFPE